MYDMCPSWSEVLVCSQAVFSCPALLPSWCDASSSRSSLSTARGQPGVYSSAQVSRFPQVSGTGVSITRACQPWSIPVTLQRQR